MTQHTNWETEILAVLDDAAQRYHFPVLDNVYFHHARIGMNSFRASDEWLIAFDQIAFDEQQCVFDHLIFAYGNKVAQFGLQSTYAILKTFSEAPGHQWCLPNGRFGLDPADFQIVIEGRTRNFRPAPDDYRAAGIESWMDMSDDARIARLLVHECPNELMATEDQLLQVCFRNHDSPEVFGRMDEWRHPNVAGDELPSESVAFSSLAHALALDDPHAILPGHPNTHWRNWITNRK